jgi:hypothetical protein
VGVNKARIIAQEKAALADRILVPKKPTIDHDLCIRAEKYATGQHVHTAANLLAMYLGEYELDEFAPERFTTAERKLRAFVSRLATSGPVLHVHRCC